MKRIIPILGCCILFSCQPVKEVVERQIVLNEEKVIVSDTSLFGKSEMITLELTDESILKNVDKVILFGDKIGIVDYSMYSF